LLIQESYLERIALITLSVRLSAYMLLIEYTAQIKAGNQPIMVICKIKQIMPAKIFPCIMSESQGKKKAKTYLILMHLGDQNRNLYIKIINQSFTFTSWITKFTKLL